MACAAAGFVAFGCSDEDDGVVPLSGFAVDDALGVAGGATALHADCAEFDDFIGGGEEFGHGAERLATEILIEPGDHDFFADVGEVDEVIDDGFVEELDFFDADDIGVFFDEFCEIAGLFDGDAGVLDAHVGDDVLFVVAVINCGFEYLNFLFGVEGSAGSADEFFGLTSVHAAANDDELATFFHSIGSPAESFSRSDSNISSSSSLISSSVARPISLMKCRI